MIKQPKQRWQIVPPIVTEIQIPAEETEQQRQMVPSIAPDIQFSPARGQQRWQIVPPIVTETRLSAIEVEQQKRVISPIVTKNRLSTDEIKQQHQFVSPVVTEGRFQVIATDALPRQVKKYAARRYKKYSRYKPAKPVLAVASILFLLGIVSLSVFMVWPQRLQQQARIAMQTPGLNLPGTPANAQTATTRGTATSTTPSASGTPSASSTPSASGTTSTSPTPGASGVPSATPTPTTPNPTPTTPQPGQGPITVKVPPANEPYNPSVPATSLGYPASDGNVRWDGGFETGDFSQYRIENWGDLDGGGWGNSSGVLVTNPVEHGSYSLKMTVNPPNSPGDANRGQISTSNAQIGASEGNSFYYSFALYIPSQPNRASGWPSWTNISQWFGGCYPMLQLFINSSGQYVVESQPNDPSVCNGNGPTQEWVIGNVAYDTWEDFTFHITWSANSSKGAVTVWHDGSLVLPTKSVQTLENNSPTWDLQVYRDGGNTNIVYFASVRVHTAYAPH